MFRTPNAMALLRVSGPDWDAESLLRHHHETRAVWWRAGDPVGDRLRTESGFNLIIGDTATSAELSDAVGRWLREHHAMLQDIGFAGVKGVLNIWLAVEQQTDLKPGMILSTSELATLARSGIELSFSAHVGAASHQN